MFKKVIALSTAAMILLTPMSASAVSWGDVVSGLKTKGSYTDGKMTATKDGDTYTFTGGQIDDYVAISSGIFGKDGKFYFNGVQMDDLDIEAKEGKYYVVLDKDTKTGFVWMSTKENGEAKLVNEGTIGGGAYTSVVVNDNSHLTNKGTLKTGEGEY